MRIPSMIQVWILFFILQATLFSPASGWAGSIREEHRICSKDQDCGLVLLQCQCMYCARPEDQASGRVDAVNRRFIKEFDKLSKCSAAELRRCATAGACAMTGKSIPVCLNQKCSIVYRSN